jgi:hypothetical protein
VRIVQEVAWMADAACRDHPTAVFFPFLDKDGKARSLRAQEAVKLPQSICAACPVFDACKDYARHEPDGIWFGTTPYERRQLYGPLRPEITWNAPRLCGCGQEFVPNRPRQVCCSRRCNPRRRSVA